MRNKPHSALSLLLELEAVKLLGILELKYNNMEKWYCEAIVF